MLLVLSVLLALFLLGDAVVRAGWGEMLLLAPWILLGLWIVYEIGYASSVRLDREGAVVQNMLRSTTFGWSRVRDIDMRWQLEFSLDDDSKVVAYGGPARSRPPRARAAGDEPARVPAGVRLLTEIRDRWEAAAGVPASAPIRRSWDTKALIALGIIAVWAAASVVIAGT
ncbi:PH domain-containing protein [Microbacterium sp. SD291]|uniref:PH domain-containing protein n=1 Tax=Microbacterium sp. SD291 TaxID=2782007 RepID=UPI0027DCC64A|nr:PH domain-containing protein [Microbacterium sp. SD291]